MSVRPTARELHEAHAIRSASLSWAKLDDGFWMNPKVIQAGNAGAGIFSRLLSYCGCYLTDGFIPPEVVELVVGSDKKAMQTLERLMLVQRMESGAFCIPDFLEHNRSKAQVEADREQRRAAGARGGGPLSDSLTGPLTGPHAISLGCRLSGCQAIRGNPDLARPDLALPDLTTPDLPSTWERRTT
jgi:hypothetical protein